METLSLRPLLFGLFLSFTCTFRCSAGASGISVFVTSSEEPGEKFLSRAEQNARTLKNGDILRHGGARRLLNLEKDEGNSGVGPDNLSATLESQDPLVKYKREKSITESWYTPFMRKQNINEHNLGEACASLAPGFDPQVLAIRDSLPPIRTLQDLRDLSVGQRVMVVAPRFGLGNTLRNWVSAFFWALISGRRIVILHGGKFHGVYTSLCESFSCAFDHIHSDDNPDKLLAEFEKGVDHQIVSQNNARHAIWWTDPVVFSFSYAFWDHWWLNNRTLSKCACSAIGGCKGGGGGLRGKALHALIAGGPTAALDETIEAVLRRHDPDMSELKLPLVESALEPAGSGLAMQFDVGIHIRTRTSIMEKPNKPFGGCKKEECDKKAMEELKRHRAMFLRAEAWDCIGRFLTRVASLRGEDKARALSVFLATDNEILRPDFVARLAPYGVVYYNGAQVAHVGVSKAGHKGRLPTMAEFYLLGKSQVVVELDNYLSTFAYFSALLGNGSLLSIPHTVSDMSRCEHARTAQKGLWSRDDPRSSSNELFSIER